MILAIREVVITKRAKHGDAECERCGARIWRKMPFNYPQVCHECADVHVWHYCDRLQERKREQ